MVTAVVVGGRAVVVVASVVVVEVGRVAAGAETAGTVSAAGSEPHPAAIASRAAKAEMRRAGRLNVTGVPGPSGAKVAFPNPDQGVAATRIIEWEVVRIALISTYELGRQPVHLASPAAALRGRGHEVAVLDLAVQPWDEGLAEWTEGAAFSVPMHTALRLAARAARRLREERPHLPIAAYGLYAPAAADDPVFDRVFGGEYEPGLAEWADTAGRDGEGAALYRGRTVFRIPDRAGLPGLGRYAALESGGVRRPAGAVETGHGCRHRCRHCPLPTVYDGRFRAVPRETVLADIGQLAEAGAEHVTFADADFFNGPQHSLRIVREMRRRWPHLTFDATIKVEHLLAHSGALGELRDNGCLFVVSAFETLNDRILEILDKGHTAAEAAEVIHLAREAGLEVHPTWLPFTPWTELGDVADVFSFVAAHDLAGITDPVQLSIRLLVPRRSLLAEHPEFLPHRGEYDPEAATYQWRSPDPMLDELAGRLAAIAEEGAGAPPVETFVRMRREVWERVGDDMRWEEAIPSGSVEGRPRLTEPWFC